MGKIIWRALAASSAIIGSAAALVSCNGGSGSSCGQVQPCGGDLVGDWTASAACLNSAELLMSIGDAGGIASLCPNFSVQTSLTVSGTFSFEANGTFTQSASVSGTATVTVPASCLTSNGATLTCDQVAQSIDAGSGAPPITCTSSVSGCSCTMTVAPQPASDMGTYTTSGTAYATMSASSGTGGGDYCVQGNTLHLMSVSNMNMGAMGPVAVLVDIVATK